MKHWAERIEAAHQSIQPYVAKTPLVWSPMLSSRLHADVYLKLEHVHPSGAFKIRGATHKLVHCTSDRVVCASTGNHGMAIAMAARQLDKKALVFMTEKVAPFVQDKIKAMGAEVKRFQGDTLACEQHARTFAEQHNIPFVSPYNDLEVIAGQGTIAVEILDDLPEVDAVFVAVSGGGLIAGIGAYFKAQKPSVQMVGCWAEHASALFESMKANRVVDYHELPTISTSTAGGIEAETVTLPICQDVIDESILLSEQAIKNAMRFMAEHEQYMLEGAAVLPVAAILTNPQKVQRKKIVLVLCGRSIDYKLFHEAVRNPK